MNRIKWAGLDAEDFELITTYEDNCYCKPNVDYYRTILEQFHLRPEECLMVGNDVEEDLAIRKLGVKTFLVTDTKENKRIFQSKAITRDRWKSCLYLWKTWKMLKNLLKFQTFIVNAWRTW